MGALQDPRRTYELGNIIVTIFGKYSLSQNITVIAWNILKQSYEYLNMQILKSTFPNWEDTCFFLKVVLV